MTALYDRFAATADRMLSKYGMAVTLARASAADATYDPATGDVTAAGGASYSGVGVMLGYTQRDIDGVQIRQGDQRLLLTMDAAIEPRSGDTVTVGLGARAYQVIASRLTAPGGTTIMHELQLRGVR